MVVSRPQFPTKLTSFWQNRNKEEAKMCRLKILPSHRAVTSPGSLKNTNNEQKKLREGRAKRARFAAYDPVKYFQSSAVHVLKRVSKQRSGCCAARPSPNDLILWVFTMLHGFECFVKKFAPKFGCFHDFSKKKLLGPSISRKLRVFKKLILSIVLLSNFFPKRKSN